MSLGYSLWTIFKCDTVFKIMQTQAKQETLVLLFTYYDMGNLYNSIYTDILLLTFS